MQIDDIWGPMRGYVVLDVATNEREVKRGNTEPKAINMAQVVSITLKESPWENLVAIDFNVSPEFAESTLYCALPELENPSGSEYTPRERFDSFLHTVGAAARLV